MKQIRKATVSGMFYDAGKEALTTELHTCFQGIETKKSQQKVTAIIVPHAGYLFSGNIAAYAYQTIRSMGIPDVFVILGPNHNGRGSGVAMSTTGSWETPLGTIPVDEPLVRMLSHGIIDPDDTTMNHQENSIEVQLPFLQYIAQDTPFSIVPIAMLMQDKETAHDVGILLAGAIQKEDRNIIMIASTDFSHEGRSYGRMTSDTVTIHDYVKTKDAPAIEMIQKKDPDGLIDIVQENQISMCGPGPVAAVLTAANKLGISSVELLKYGTSYEVHPDRNACVGYASFAIY